MRAYQFGICAGIIFLSLPVYAKSVWLLIRDGTLDSPAFEKIEMESMDQCEMQGALYVSSKRLYRTSERRGFECIEGK